MAEGGAAGAACRDAASGLGAACLGARAVDGRVDNGRRLHVVVVARRRGGKALNPKPKTGP